MELSGIHLLLTYQCTHECDHCFVWGSPRQSGTMTVADLHDILRQAREVGSVEWVYFEGGEPFLFYPTLLRGVRMASALGFRVGVVSNGYWAVGREDAEEALRPLAGLVQDLSISTDLYHYEEAFSAQAARAQAAASLLGIPLGLLSAAPPESACAASSLGQLPNGESAVMYRGRAAAKLAARATPRPWGGFTACPHEDLVEPGRLHVDPFGNLHICQGIVVGNLRERSLRDVCSSYRPAEHPITAPLLAGGPAELVRRYDLPHAEAYADACHLCYEARRALRAAFPALLAPGQMYGDAEAASATA